MDQADLVEAIGIVRGVLDKASELLEAIAEAVTDQGGGMVPRRAHNAEDAGSSPAPGTNARVEEGTPRRVPNATAAGSSPAAGSTLPPKKPRLPGSGHGIKLTAAQVDEARLNYYTTSANQLGRRWLCDVKTVLNALRGVPPYDKIGTVAPIPDSVIRPRCHRRGIPQRVQREVEERYKAPGPALVTRTGVVAETRPDDWKRRIVP